MICSIGAVSATDLNDNSTVEVTSSVDDSISVDEASIIMLNIHNKGKELCGTYTYEIAATKVAQVKSMAREQGFPLKAIMEEE